LLFTVAKVKALDPEVVASPLISDAENVEPLPRTIPVNAAVDDHVDEEEK
jgi:hypothetical protein